VSRSSRQIKSFYCLDIISEVGQLKAGAGAEHRLSVRSYAIKQVEVRLTSECKKDVLEYKNGKTWKPKGMSLPPAGIGRRKQSADHVENELLAGTAKTGQREALEISAWRHLLQGSIEAFPPFPVHVDVS
jgi:hypothetical protein